MKNLISTLFNLQILNVDKHVYRSKTCYTPSISNVLFTARLRSTREGNVFTFVSSTGGKGVPWPGQGTPCTVPWTGQGTSHPAPSKPGPLPAPSPQARTRTGYPPPCLPCPPAGTRTGSSMLFPQNGWTNRYLMENAAFSFLPNCPLLYSLVTHYKWLLSGRLRYLSPDNLVAGLQRYSKITLAHFSHCSF